MTKIYAYVGNGKLGSLLGKRPNFAFLDCDITNPASIEMALKLFEIRWGKPDLIVNCAGLTSIDECEKDETKAYALNVRGLSNLHGIFGNRVLHISSDQVFSGKYFLAPTESTKPKPINYYGYSKWGSEQVSEVMGGKIIRLSRTIDIKDHDLWSYITHLEHKRIIEVPSFLWRNYLTRSQAVQGIEYFATHYDSMPQIVNYGGEANVSMYTLVQEISRKLGLNVSNVLPRTKDISSEIPRPHWGGYKVGLASRLGFPMYNLREVIGEFCG